MSYHSSASTNWKPYVIEVFVVFIGVMSAFLLSSWAESRQQAELEEDYLISIRSDLQQDQQSITENIQILTDHRRMLDKFLSDPMEGWTSDSTSMVIANSLTLLKFSGKTSTYESMKFSGQLSLIHDFELRGQVVDYYESFSELTLIEETTTFWITQYLTPFYTENFDMMESRFIDPDTVNQQTFKNRMIGYRVLLQQNLSMYLNLRESNVSLFNKLAEFLDE